MSYFIQVKMRAFDGVGNVIFQMNGADKDIVKWIIDTYGRPSYEVKICPEIESTEKGSEQQRWLEGKQ